MRAKIDGVGRIVVPKPLRDALGLTPGTEVDISAYGDGLHVTAGARAGRVVEHDGRLVITGEGVLTDEAVYALIDAARR